jgi:alkaline phosphatase D
MSRALAEHNPEVSPHLSFVDLCGHGYSIVRVDQEHLEAEFICIPRPLERSERADGGPLLYRITHRIKLWKPGDAPRLEQKVLEGSPASNQT